MWMKEGNSVARKVSVVFVMIILTVFFFLSEILEGIYALKLGGPSREGEVNDEG